MRLFKIICRSSMICLGITVSVACSHAPSASDIPANVSFTTNILANDTKLFTYTVGGMRGGPGGEGDMDDMPPARGGMGGARKGPSVQSLLRGVEAMLAQNHYCRDGFVVLEQYEQRLGYVVRGECRDSASHLDREKFPGK